MRINPPGLRTFLALLLVAASLTFTGGVVAERWGANATHGTGEEEDAAGTPAGADQHAADGEATPAHEETGESDEHAEATAAADRAEEPDEHAAAGTAVAESAETHEEGAGEQTDSHAEEGEAADAHAAVEHTFLGVNTWSNGFLVVIVAASALLAAALAWRPHPALLLGVIAFSLVLVAFDLDAAFTATVAGGFPVPLGALTAILHLGAAALAALALAERRAPSLAPEHA